MAKKERTGIFYYHQDNDVTKPIVGIKWVFDSEDEAGNQIHCIQTKEELGEEWFQILCEEVKSEANEERKNAYHNPASLDDADYEGEWFADNATPAFHLNIEEELEHVKEFINVLTDNQREKLEYKIAHPEASLRDIASHFGVALASIRDTFNYIKKKYLTFFELGTTQTA